MKNLIQTSCFIDSSVNNNYYEFSPNNFLDERNYSIYNNSGRFYLTKRELIFLKLLIKNSIVSYEEMEEYIWNGEDTTKNAILLFVRNFRKKVSSKVLINLTGIGYKLNKDEDFSCKLDNSIPIYKI